MGAYIGNGGALSTGYGSVFLWLFCALAFLKTAQKFDSYLAAMGLNVAQTGSSMGMELLMAARVVTGIGHGARSAGHVFGGATATGTGAAASGFASGLLIPDMTNEEEQLLDEALIKTYLYPGGSVPNWMHRAL